VVVTSNNTSTQDKQKNSSINEFNQSENDEVGFSKKKSSDISFMNTFSNQQNINSEVGTTTEKKWGKKGYLKNSDSMKQKVYGQIQVNADKIENVSTNMA